MSEHIKFIRTTTGDKQIDYTALANLPTINNQELTGNIDINVNNATVDSDGYMSAMDKIKLEDIEEGAQVNTVNSVNDKTGDVVLSAADVGADALGSADTALESAKAYTTEKFVDLVGTSPDNLDTIYELAAAVEENQTVIDSIEAAITNKADKEHIHDIEDVTNLQTQLDSKLPLAGGTITGNLLVEGTTTVQGGITNINLPDNTDLNNITITGFYRASDNNKVATLTNCPTARAFHMYVGKTTGSGTVQTLITYTTSGQQIYTRNCHGGTWGSWREIAFGDHNHDGIYAKLQADNNLIAHGNEFTFAKPSMSGEVWLNYRTASGSDGGITKYNFGNGAGGTTGVTLQADSFTGNAASASYLKDPSGVDYKNGIQWSGSVTTPNGFCVFERRTDGVGGALIRDISADDLRTALNAQKKVTSGTTIPSTLADGEIFLLIK